MGGNRSKKRAVGSAAATASPEQKEKQKQKQKQSSFHNSGEDDEWGYFLLEKVPVQIIPSSSNASETCNTIQPQKQWLPVSWQKPGEGTQKDPPTNDEKSGNEEERPSSPLNDTDGVYCPFCVVLTSRASDFWLKSPTATYEHDGNLKSMSQTCDVCRRRHNHSNEDLYLMLGNQQQQSVVNEFSVLWGMLRFCRGVLQIQSVEARLLPSSANIKTTYISVVITVTFPLMSEHSILESAARISMLHPATQALLATIRSDWGYLDWYQQQQGALSTNIRESVVPSEKSLDQIYRQNINKSGSCSACLSAKPDDPNTTKNIERLSVDIWAVHIAPFLDARSFQSTVETCRYLRHMLRDHPDCLYVPGLRRSNIRLYQHQRNSLRWMRRRERVGLTESTILQQLVSDEEEGDLHRAASGSDSTRLRLRRSRLERRINPVSGRDYRPGVDRALARGGLLCDDPGLGKTITVLSLILQTAGMMPSVSAGGRGDSSEELLFQAYWREQYEVFEIRRTAVLRLTNSFLRDATTLASRYGNPQMPFGFELSLFRPLVERREWFSFAEMELQAWNLLTDAVEGSFGNGAAESEEEERQLLKALMTCFDKHCANFKAKCVEQARKSFSSVKTKPNSPVAALVTETSKEKFLQSLCPSKATLLVVPAVLVDHWEDQIRRHVDMKYLATAKPLIYCFGAKESRPVKSIWRRIRENKYSPVVFIDRGGTKELPSPEFLAQFQIVITSTQRFVHEWKNGSFQDELRRSELKTKHGAAYYNRASSDSKDKGSSSLLRVYWFRMVIDEGHTMGKCRENSSIQFASWIAAERRWAMTGTPTKQGTGAAELNQIYALFRFLGHELFSTRGDGISVWKQNIAQQWKNGNLVAFYRLRSLLRVFMRRHTKIDIIELPRPKFRKEVIPMSETEVTTYNTLVFGIQSNIVLTARMTGKTSERKQDSLLHRSNARHARTALANVRRVCIGWTQVIPMVSDKHWRETLDLAEVHNLELGAVRKFMHQAESLILSHCSVCHLGLTTLLLPPCCGRLVCSECFDSESTTCIVCEQEYSVDDFQRLQPGFEMTWKSNANPKGSRRLTGGPYVPPDPPSNVVPLLLAPPDPQEAEEQEQPRRRTRKPGDGHVCDFNRSTGKCKLCWEEHSGCNFMTFGNASSGRRQCETCGKWAEDCTKEESKSCYLVDRLLRLYANQQFRIQSPQQGQPPPPQLKAIVFSQFRSALNVVGTRLILRLGPACVAEYWGSYRRQELRKFIHDPLCICMLLTKDGSEGLDLSFVTHIFFLEEIWDQALRDQALARAWRMGATGSVQVETLIAKNSVEEQLLSPDLDTAAPSALAGQKGKVSKDTQKEWEQTKTIELLKGLRFITDYHRLGSGLTEAEPSKDIGRTIKEEIIEGSQRKRKNDDEYLPRKRVVKFSDPT